MPMTDEQHTRLVDAIETSARILATQISEGSTRVAVAIDRNTANNLHRVIGAQQRNDATRGAEAIRNLIDADADAGGEGLRLNTETRRHLLHAAKLLDTL